MAETENTTQETQPTQPKVGMKPKWLIDTERIEKQKDQGIFVQVAWKSTNTVDCEPIGLTQEMDHSEYPISIERPTGYWAPKMDWNAVPHWLETANIQQGMLLEELKKQVTELSKTTETVQTQQKNQNVESAQSSQLMMMVTKQLGIMNTKINDLADKIAPAKPTNVTTPTTPAEPTQPTTATQPTTPATEGGAQ